MSIENMPIKVQYQLTESEYVAIAGRYILRNFLLRRAPLLLVVYIIYVLLVGVSVKFDVLIWVLGFLGIFILVALIAAFSFFYPVILYRRDPKLQARYSVEFSDEGIAAKGPFGESNLNWSYYKNVMETKRGYVLGAGASRPQLIPKSAFDPAQQASFKQLLQRKLAA